MRDLTPEECEFIAGGMVRGARHLDNEVAPVVVVASPPPYYPPPYYPPPAPPPYYPPPPPGGGGGGGGGLGGGTGPFQGTNCAANSIHTQIDGSSNVNSAEHVAITYKGSDGQIYTSPVFTGSGEQAGLNQVFTWMQQNGVAFSQVTSLVHNHDSVEYGTSADEAAVNRYPSGTTALGGSDWSAADYFVQQGANPSVFSLYVEDTSHVMRDFNYSQESYYKGLTQQQMENGSGLPSATPKC